MTTRSGFRGQPLILLGVVLAGWTGVRLATWSSPFVAMPDLAVPGIFVPDAAESSPEEAPVPLFQSPVSEATPSWRRPMPEQAPGRPEWERDWSPAPVGGWQGAAALPDALQHLVSRPGMAKASAIVGHNRLLAAAFAGGVTEATPMATGAPVLPTLYRPEDKRWSADAWALLRGGQGAGVVAAGQPSYGRSQAGGVFRYTLVPGGRMKAQAHLRAVSALQGPQEREMAVGITARPLPGVPVRLGSEVRIYDAGNGGELRPAFLAVSEFPPIEPVRGVKAETYLQAGYIGGKYATGFVDGQARVTVDVAEFGRSTLSAGGGVWGGAQKGASRLDVGPGATLSFPLGEGYGRVAADYRIRVAGDATPGNGPAVTVSTGF